MCSIVTVLGYGAHCRLSLYAAMCAKGNTMA